MTTLQLCIDAGPARQGAREFARRAEDIRRAAVTVTQAVESLDTAVSNADGAFDRLGRSLLDLRDPLGESGLVDVATGITNDIRLALNNPIFRDGFVSVASSLRSTFSQALIEAAKKDSTAAEGLLDSLAGLLDEFGPALSLFGRQGAVIVRSLRAVIPVVRLVSRTVNDLGGEVRSVESLFQSFIGANAEIPRLRQDLVGASGKRREVIAQELAEREAHALRALDEFTAYVLHRRMSAVSQSLDQTRSFESTPPESLEGQLVQDLRLFREMFLRSNDPVAREHMRLFLSGPLPPLPERFLPLLELPALGNEKGSEPSTRSDLLVRPGFAPNDVSPTPLFTRAAFGSGVSFGGGPLDIDGIIEANRMIGEGLGRNLRASRDFADGAEAAFQSYAESASDVAGQTQDLVTDGLRGMEDALVGFVQTGKIEFGSLIDSLIADLTRLQVRAAVLGPLSDFVGALFSSGSTFTAPPGAPPTAIQAPGATSRQGLRQGGVFRVPGSGSGDKVVPLLEPGEIAAIFPRGNAMPFGSTVNVNVINEAGARVDVQERDNGQGGVDIEVLIARAVERDIADGGRVARAIARNFGARPAAIGR